MRWRTCSDAPSGASTSALVRGPAYCGTADKNTGGKREEHVSMAADGNGTTNDGRGDDGADHSEHEKLRNVGEERGIDDLGTDGVGYASTNTDGAGKFHDGGENHGLEIGHGLGGDRRRPRVGHIVGTCETGWSASGIP